MKKKISLFVVLVCIFMLLPVWATAAIGEGNMSSKYNSIKAETIEVMEKGSWKEAWSLEA